MILVYYPPLHRKETVVKSTSVIVTSPVSVPPTRERFEYGDMARATRLGISDDEFKRRCGIVKEAWQKCTLIKDDTVYPVNAQDYQHYGAMRVIGVASNYRNMLETEWPKNDNPFIVCLTSIAGQAHTTFATHGWASKTNHHLKVQNVQDSSQTC